MTLVRSLVGTILVALFLGSPGCDGSGTAVPSADEASKTQPLAPPKTEAGTFNSPPKLDP